MNKIRNYLNSFIGNKSVAILGFGREGQSTYRFLRAYYSQISICIADANEQISEHGLLKCDDNIVFELGNDFLDNIVDYDIVFKSPGISFKDYNISDNQIISSQTDLFLRLFSSQTIGVTGTKGKSTTVSLLHHVLKEQNKDVLLIGNIGTPALDVVNDISDETILIYEMSSHQLEFVSNSPHISILLNLYQEHLDHYNSYSDYRNAKWNIAKHQNIEDYFIFCSDEKLLMEDFETKRIISQKLNYSFSANIDSAISYVDNNLLIRSLPEKQFGIKGYKLIGKHNVYNLMAVLLVAEILTLSISDSLQAANSFKGLPHRLEFVETIADIKFYNDSIATIPQATIKAIESIRDVDTLILGGYDRGIDYSILYDFLKNNSSINLLLYGEVGKRIGNSLNKINSKFKIYQLESFDDFIEKALEITEKGKSCLLSPAASSYDSFKNFEERGDRFKELISVKLIKN